MIKENILSIRRFIKDMVFELLGVDNHLSSDRYIQKLRSKGCQIGPGTRFFGEKCLDLGHPQLITIGNDCVITDGVRVLTHMWDYPILSNRFEKVPEFSKKGSVKIGDNVFIGERSIILPETEIGKNTIIGAGSVVSSDIPSDSVAAGNPCRVVCSIEEYKDQRLTNEMENITNFVRISEKRGIQIPSEFDQYLDSSSEGEKRGD